MSKNMKSKIKVNANAWSDMDRQAFADGNILKSHKIPNKKRVQARRACRGRVDVD